MSAINLRSADELRTRVRATLDHIAARASELSAEAIAAELQIDAEELALRGFEAGLLAAHGPQMGAAVFADLTGRLEVSDAELARRFGVTRAAVSKTLIRVRRNLGLPVRKPNNARPGRTP